MIVKTEKKFYTSDIEMKSNDVKQYLKIINQGRGVI